MDEWKAIDTQAGNLYNLNINIADSHNIRFINNIKSEARRMKDNLNLIYCLLII
jgi:replicative DNA helicase